MVLNPLSANFSLKPCLAGFSLFGKRRVSLLATKELNKLNAVAQKLSITVGWRTLHKLRLVIELKISNILLFNFISNNFGRSTLCTVVFN